VSSRGRCSTARPTLVHGVEGGGSFGRHLAAGAAAMRDDGG
jgi:hypothetical protein